MKGRCCWRAFGPPRTDRPQSILHGYRYYRPHPYIGMASYDVLRPCKLAVLFNEALASLYRIINEASASLAPVSTCISVAAERYLFQVPAGEHRGFFSVAPYHLAFCSSTCGGHKVFTEKLKVHLRRFSANVSHFLGTPNKTEHRRLASFLMAKAMFRRADCVDSLYPTTQAKTRHYQTRMSDQPAFLALRSKLADLSYVTPIAVASPWSCLMFAAMSHD
jgi:hypothetical protein